MINNLILLMSFCLSFTMLQAQENVFQITGKKNIIFIDSLDASVEKRIYSISLGIGDIFIEAENRLSNSFTLNSSIGLGVYGANVLSGSEVEAHGFSLTAILPKIQLEPRYYYNLNRRRKLGENTLGNSGNYIGLRNEMLLPAVLEEIPSFFKALQNEYLYNIFLVYGARRQFKSNFFFDFSAGIGQGYNIYVESIGNQRKYYRMPVTLNFKIGYKF